MNEDLYITFNNGRGKMIIHMDAFFPCRVKFFKSLLNIINEDYRHEDELLNQLREYLKYRIALEVKQGTGKTKEKKLIEQLNKFLNLLQSGE
jgi:hypothetical protein